MARVASPAARFVGQRIDSHRLERGLTQDQLAAATHIDSANLRAYISGRAMPNVYSLVRISSALEVALGQLLDGLTPEHFATQSKAAIRSPKSAAHTTEAAGKPSIHAIGKDESSTAAGA